ncbi:MAG: 2-oxoacid:ferredoxin oxidoreductase subunit beta, partial [Nitrospirae bacterium]|nr:2-oxoacid:ferredoxin oxidoreductase subunit beta [Nitrospirota bacterium]
GDIIKKAIEHKGFSFVNVISPCPTYNTVDTFEYYRPRIQSIEEVHPDKTNRVKAFELAEASIDHTRNPEAKVPVGVFYQVTKPTYEEKVAGLKVRYKGTDTADLMKLFSKFRA